MSVELNRERLLQINNLERIRRNLKATDMVTVYRWAENESPIKNFFLCALIPPGLVESLLSDTNVDNFRAESRGGMPSAFDCNPQISGSQIEYLRFGNDEGIEPLVVHRNFSRIRDGYIEISEEFCHFHDLYHNRETDEYIKIDDAGNEEIVAVIKDDEVKIRLKEIRQFLAVKEVYLSILFEFNEYSEYSIQELELSKNKGSEMMGLNALKSQPDPSTIFGEFQREDLICWTFSHVDTPNREFRSDSRLRGRKLIKPLPKSKSGFGDFAEESEHYAEFIVDVDEGGDKVLHTCNPRNLNDFPSGSSDPSWSFNYVYFRKQVLDKYYNELSKYSVENSIIRCGSLWSMKIDDHQSPSIVCVFLRDLGIDLPYTEQLHWRAYNIPPEGEISETAIRRNFMGEWASSDQPDFLFKQSYNQLQDICVESLGWQLLKPLGPKDRYHLQRLRIPVSDEQCHFDDLVQDLQMVLIESLNVKELKKRLPATDQPILKGKRGIEILKEVLSFHAIEGVDHHIEFLQKLQALRSLGSGHLKGGDYQKISNYFGVDILGQQQAFIEILNNAYDTINFFMSIVGSGKFNSKHSRDC